MLEILNPTGGRVRKDEMGDGVFGASRDGGNRSHRGVDFVCIPGQYVVAPVDCKIGRRIQVYADTAEYQGVELKGDYCNVILYYVDVTTKRKIVKAGDIIADAQDISKRYGPRMTPHVHCELYLLVDPLLFLERTHYEIH